MRTLHFLGLPVFILFTVCEVSAQTAHFRQNFQLVPKSEANFVADGVVTAQEAANSSIARNFNDFTNGTTDPRPYVRVAYRSDLLYVALGAEYPTPIELSAKSKDDETNMWSYDDIYELRIPGFQGNNYNFVGNAAGFSAERLYKPNNFAWEPGTYTYGASSTPTSFIAEWVFEPATFGLERFEPGMRIPMDAVHNNRTYGISSWAYLAKGWHANEHLYPELILGEDDSAFVRELNIGVLSDDEIGIRMELGGTDGDEAMVRFYRAEQEFGDSFHVVIDGFFDPSGPEILPGATVEELTDYAIDQTLQQYRLIGSASATASKADGETLVIRKPKEPGSYLVEYTVTDASDGTYRTAAIYPIKVAEPLSTGIDNYFLSRGGIELKTALPVGHGFDRLVYELRTPGGNEVLSSSNNTELPDSGTVQGYLSTRELPAGEYELTVHAFSGGDTPAATYQNIFLKPETPFWWDSGAGMPTEVPEPWTPVELSGNAVSVWGRQVTLSDNGLPQSIITQGEELLATPIRLDGSVNGSPVALKGSSLKPTSESPLEVVTEAQAKLGDIPVTVRTQSEFDGMMRFDITLPESAGTTIDELFLEIPFTDEAADFWSRYLIGDMPQKDLPANYLRDYPKAGYADKATHMPFAPGVALRNDTIGMQWFAENVRNWSNENPEKRIEIIPEGDEVILRIRLVDKPLALDRDRTYTFGLHPWPVKPWPESVAGINRYFDRFEDDGEGIQGFGETVEDAIANTEKILETADIDVLWYFHWNAVTSESGSRILPPDYPVVYNDEVHERMLRTTAFSGAVGMPMLGHVGFGVPQATEDFEFYGKEMSRRPLIHKGQFGYKPTPSKPFRDAFVGRFGQLIEDYQWSGVQYDGTLNPHFDQSTYNTEPVYQFGWYDEDGNLRGSYPIFALRELAKRMYVLFNDPENFENIDRGFLYSHVTETYLTPTNVFAHKIHDGENRDTMLAESISDIDWDFVYALYPHYATGIPVDWLMKAGKAPAGPRGRIAHALATGMEMQMDRVLQTLRKDPKPSYEKDSQHIYLIWDAYDWVNAGPDTFKGYWRETDRFEVTEGEALVSSHWNPETGRMLLAVINPTKEDQTVRIELNEAVLGLNTENLTVEDGITGDIIETDGTSITIDLPEDHYRLYRVTLK